MKTLASCLMASVALCALGTATRAEVAVVASIKPVHSLVAAVMEGVGEPGLIVDGAGSPHTYSLKPSEAAMIENADVIFWVGPQMETFLEKSIETIGANAKSVKLIDAHGITKLEFREGGAFDEHAHDDHDEHGHGASAEGDHDDDHGHEETAEADHHDDHGHEETAEADHDDGHDHEETAGADHDDGHDHEETAEADHHDDHDHEETAEADRDDDHDHEETSEADHHDGHDHEETAEADHDDDHDHEETAEGDHHDDHDHAHGGVDGHVWLDPENAKAMVHEIEESLVALDPDNAATYEANAEAVTAELDALIAEVDGMLVPVRDKGFIVFHDAYHYFENRFGISAAGSITISPEVIPGAERITEIQGKVGELGATCVFAEPQFEPKLVSVVVEGTDARSGVLDPLGTGLEDGPDLYFSLIQNLATSVRDCLAEAS